MFLLLNSRKALTTLRKNAPHPRIATNTPLPIVPPSNGRSSFPPPEDGTTKTTTFTDQVRSEHNLLLPGS